jgi:hypothetical protein
MYEKNHQFATSGTGDSGISKDERYELIAQIAQRVREFKESEDMEERNIWDSNDTDINFDEFVNHYG